MKDRDFEFLRKAMANAEMACAHGDPPFGAVVVALDGSIIAEAASTQRSTGDPTAHAEINAVRRAMASGKRTELQTSTIYASAEPCAMCSAAIFYAGIGRVVYGLSEDKFRLWRNQREETAGVPFSCRAILSRPSRRVEVSGPHLENEAWPLHARYWNSLQ